MILILLGFVHSKLCLSVEQKHLGKKLQMKKNIDIIFKYQHECDLVVSKQPCSY